MEYMGFDLAKPGSEKTVIIIPGNAEVRERNRQMVVTIDGQEFTYPKGTIVFSQDGLKDACDWNAPTNTDGE